MNYSKPILTFLINFIFYNLFVSQKLIVEYDFVVNNYYSNRSYLFPSNLEVDEIKNISIYTVNFGITNNNVKIINNKIPPNNSYNSKDFYDYQIVKTNNKNLIKDKLNDSFYFFVDDVPNMIWTEDGETKQIDGIVLHKAVTNFRGRTFIVFYKKDSKKILPWKFNNINGIIYEVSDDSKSFLWFLKKIRYENNDVEIPNWTLQNPLKSYKEYENLRYGISKEIFERAIKYGGKISEQPRDGIELKF